MRIERPQDGAATEQAIADSLEEMTRAVIRSGPVCAPDCSRAGCSPCARNCPHIPQMLSSDPEVHPVEQAVAPLAFEIKKLGVFTPCWSCEGHNDANGVLRNAPAVWFYAHSVTHVRVLSEAISEMFYDKRLSSRWQVCLTFSDPDNAGTTFALEPASGVANALSPLRADLQALSEDIGWRMEKQQAALLRSIR